MQSQLPITPAAPRRPHKIAVAVLVVAMVLAVGLIGAEYVARQKVNQQILDAVTSAREYTVTNPQVQVGSSLMLWDLWRGQMRDVQLDADRVDLKGETSQPLQIDNFHAKAHGVDISSPNRADTVTASGELTLVQLERRLPQHLKPQLVGQDGLIVLRGHEGILRLEAGLSLTPAPSGRALKLSAKTLTINGITITDLGKLSDFEYEVALDQLPSGLTIDEVTVDSDRVSFTVVGNDIDLAQTTGGQ